MRELCPAYNIQVRGAVCAYVSVRNLTCEVFGVVWYSNPNVCPSWALPFRVTTSAY